MIKKIKLFINNNEQAIKMGEMLTEKLIQNGFILDELEFDLAVAVGGDGAFLRMIKETNFNSDVLYVGINAGTLGFLQEIKGDQIDAFIEEVKARAFKVEEIGIQETIIHHASGTSRFFSLNEIVIREQDLKVVKLDIEIEGDLLERFIGDGLLVATSSGSTAYNLSFGGSIVYNTFTSLQITPIAPINSKVYRSLLNSVIIPDKKVVTILPDEEKRDLILTIDGENHFYPSVTKVETKIENKKIKFVRLSHYNFPQKINEKLLMN